MSDKVTTKEKRAAIEKGVGDSGKHAQDTAVGNNPPVAPNPPSGQQTTPAPDHTPDSTKR